jgi:hypothetical protein
LMKLQIEGKKPLGVAEFLRGFPGICLFR